MAKAHERVLARELRAKGYSLSEICSQVTAAKSTVSLWVRDVSLSLEQATALGEKTSRIKHSQTMRERREVRVETVRRQASAEYELLSLRREFVFGLALYVGEGTKAVPAKIALTNCDERVQRFGLRFLEVIGIDRARVRCAIQLHPGIDEEPVLSFWESQLGISRSQFLPVYRKVSRASLDKAGHKQPNGVCTIYTFSMPIWLKLHRWMELALQDN